MNRSLIIPILLLLASTTLVAQERNVDPQDSDLVRTRYGLFGGVNLALHTASFTALPGFPNCCPEFRSGFGLNPAVEGIFEIPLSNSLALSLRAGFDPYGADLSRDEVTTVEQDGEAVETTIVHEIRSNINTIGVAALVAMPVGDRLRVLGGLRTGLVIGADFVGDERLSDESTRGTFENGERVRNEYEGDIPGASSLLAGPTIGVSYDLPLNTEGTWLAVPEISGTFGLLPVSSDVSWNAHSLRVGVAIVRSPRKRIEAPNPPIIAMTPPPGLVTAPEREPIVASVSAAGISADGRLEPEVNLRVEEVVAAEVRPLLGYLFFNESNADLPTRYGRISSVERELFEPEEIDRDDPMAVQLRSLDVIGFRMTNATQATIEIVGTNDGASESIALSQERADEAKEYLVDRWGIDPSRITTSARGLPARPSNPEVADGQAENRRIEIASSDRSILAPVRLVDTIRRATPPTIRFSPTVTSGEVASWSIVAEQNGEELKRIDGVGTPPAQVDWTIDTEEGTMPRAPGEMTIRMEVTDSEGMTKTASETSIDVRQVTLSQKARETAGGVEIERYNLVLFDFDRAELTDRHRSTVAEISRSIPSGSRVVVRGFTDRIGDAERNRRLALERARNVAAALSLPDGTVTVEAGTGYPFDNSTPDGRFYSRTVQIEVELPGGEATVD